jgi:penicillin-binding protein 2
MRVRSENNRVRPVRLPAARGVVYDRFGEILVDNRPSFNAIFVPEDAPDRRLVLRNVSLYLNEPESDLLQRLRSPGKRPPYEGVALRRDVDWQGVVALETHQLDLPGVSLQVVPKRFYPFGPLAAHLLGYVSEVNARDLEADASGGECAYRQGDLGGKAGLERALDGDLCGRAGVQHVEVDAHGRRMRLLEERADQSGRNVTLTIDRDLQETAERALGEGDGSIVALDPRNGEVLVMASRPTFDPNVFARGIRRDEWRALVQDKKHPLNNRAIQGQYPPGSTFKMIVAAGALEKNIISVATGFGCGGGLQFGGHYFRCWRKGGHGAMALHDALVQSCDVYFYQAGQRLGVDGIADYSHRFGLGLPTGILLDHEKAGIIPSTEWKQKRFKQPWFAGETLSVAIGQGYVTTTPLQLAQYAAILANGGTRYRPQYVKRIEAADGTLVHELTPEVLGETGIKPSTFARIREAMRDVVMTERGTGTKARVAGIEVAGKTGTAQSVGERDKGARDARTRQDHALFIAFAPVEKPEIAVAVIVEHAGEHGGTVAAPMAQQVMERYFTRGAPTVPLPPAPPPTTEAHATGSPAHHPL